MTIQKLRALLNTALCAEVKHGGVGRSAPHTTISVLNVIAHLYMRINQAFAIHQ
jgi:hypothetical protein